jgi:hypothetical protein
MIMTKNQWNIVVIIDGHTLQAKGDGTESGTVFKGRQEDVLMAKAVIRHRFPITLGNPRFSPTVTASYDSPMGLTAALMGAAPSDAVIWKAPKDVIEFIDGYQNKNNYEKRIYGMKG